MNNIKKYFKSDKRQKKESQTELDALMPNYEKELNVLNAKFGVALQTSIEVSPAGIIPKLKVILIKDIPVTIPESKE